MHTDAFGAIRVSHREYIGQIAGKATGEIPNWNSYQFVLNPGDGRTFPWLAPIAAAFTQWKLLGSCFEFQSTCGNAVSSTNSSLGTVSMMTQYDVLQPPSLSKQYILNHFWAGNAKPSENQLHCVECEPNVTPLAPLYIRTPTLGTATTSKYWSDASGAAGQRVVFQENYDPRLYDHGRVEIFVTGQQANFVVGDLWHTYDLLLLKPRRLNQTTANTWDPPPPGPSPTTPVYTHFPEVPLTAVIPIDDLDYPAQLEEVDEKVDV